MSPRRELALDKKEPPRSVSRYADEREEVLEMGLRPRRLDEFVGQARVKEHLQIVLEAARRREQPVDHLLFAGPPGLGKTTLAGIVEDCHHLLKIRASNRGITIHEMFESDLPRLWADERAIRQICLNLLSNAIKFTPQGGEIWLKVGWTASGGQYMSVKDTGPGIPEEEIPIVLASFGQGSNSIKSAEQGAGLGLPIAKSLVDLHGGTFTLKSKLRIGTEVVVTFPPERVVAAMAPMKEHAAPPIAPPPGEPVLTPEERQRLSRRPLFRVGT